MSNLLYSNIMKQLNKSEKILQLGCGTGNLARMLIYSSYKYIRGVDANIKIIQMAHQSIEKRHHNKFIEGYFDDESVYDINYDTIICTEVFEYADSDIKILSSVKEGAKIIFSVPGHPNEVFSRWFSSENEIKSRYKDLIDIQNIETIFYNSDGCKTYLINCIKK